MVNPNFDVTPLDIWSFRQDVEGALDRFKDYFRVLVSPEVFATPNLDLSSAPHLTVIPNISFSAYHPDCVYAGGVNGMLKGPMDAYHSLIIIAAHQKGMSQDDAASLFRGDFYERCGFMDYWLPQRDRLVNDFAAHEFDIQNEVRRWGRSQAFMHTIDHPKIHCLYGVARSVMKSMGVPDVETHVIPQDNLAIGAVWAVYPEIGEHLGVEGAYRFKRFGAYLQRPDGRFVDIYRQQIDPDGFAGPVEVAEARSAHLAAVRQMFLECDVFVFTLGLTEAWRSRCDGSIFPVAPGVVGGAFDSDVHEFKNFGVDEVQADLELF